MYRISQNYLRLLVLQALLFGAASAFAQAGGVAAEPDVNPPSDPHDLSGMWALSASHGGSPGAPTAAGPAGAANYLSRRSVPPVVKKEFQDKIPQGTLAPNQGALPNSEAAMLCVPDGYFGSGGGYPNYIIQTPTQITLINEENHRTRRIYLDRQHPKNIKPSYAGHSVGRWEGDTLVVDTVGLRNRIGTENPPGYHIVERFKKANGGRQLEYSVNFMSDAYETPGTNSGGFWWRPDLHLQEQICEEFSDNFNDEYKFK